MKISVEDGKVDLQLGFKLGLPGDEHLAPSQPISSHSPRYKNPARKAKDKARAAAHHQKQLHLTNSESALHQQHGAGPALLYQQAVPAILNCPPQPLPQTVPVAEHHYKTAVPAVKAVPASTSNEQFSKLPQFLFIKLLQLSPLTKIDSLHQAATALEISR